MATLAQQAEILKMARLLEVPAEQLDYLQKLDAGAIRSLRERAAASLFDTDIKLFQRMASASRQLPAHLCARLAERAFGPLLCAKMTGLVAPDRAVEIARHLHTSFLTEVCIQLDPRAARAVLIAMPLDRIVEVAGELAHRREFITMGRFVDNISDGAVHATAAALADEALLRIGFFVEEDARLCSVIELLPRDRLRGMILIAADSNGELWPEALAFINRVDEAQRRIMADLAAGLEEAVLLKMIAATHEQELWAEMLPVVAMMHSDNQRRLVNLPAVQDEAVLAAMMRAAAAGDLWPQLLALVALMDEKGRDRAAGIAADHGPVAAEVRKTGLRGSSKKSKVPKARA